MRFNNKVAAGVLVGLAFAHMVYALSTGHSARAETPPDLGVAAADVGLDVWKAASLMVERDASVTVVDVRPEVDFALSHVPGAVNDPGGDVDRLAGMAQAGPLLLTAATDEEGLKLATKLRSVHGDADIYFLEGGPRAWYLAVELPVPMFNEAPPPRGYEEAVQTVRRWFHEHAMGPTDDVAEAVKTLARLNYQPTLLGKTSKPKAGGAKKKKIAGGCG